MLTAAEAATVCEAYGIPIPQQRAAAGAADAAAAAAELGFPVAVKMLSSDVTHKSDVGGVVLGLNDAAAVSAAVDGLLARLGAAAIAVEGVLVQSMARSGLELVVGGASDPTFGKIVMFGLGGVLVETRPDVTFALAPVSADRARAMLHEIASAALLDGVRGQPAVDQVALADVILRVSELITDIPEVVEIDLNPVLASAEGVCAVDARIALGDPPSPRTSIEPDAILETMRRIMRPESIAVIGASAEVGKIGYAVVRNILDGGFGGAVHPINPRGGEIQGLPAYKSILDVPGSVDVAVFAIPAAFVAGALEEAGQKRVAAAILIPSGFAEIGETALQEEVVAVARKYGVRLMGPNIYGYYSTPAQLCATFCTPYTERGDVALSSQSGGVGMAVIGYSRSHQMGVSAIVGLGNKSDLDEDDLLTYYAQDPATRVIAMHVEDIKDGRSFVDVAKRVSKERPIVVLKAGRTAAGARAAASHTGALAGQDAIYSAAFREAGVIRAHTLEQLLDWSHALSMLPPPTGENLLIITGAGGSGVLLADACSDYGLKLMSIPDDLGDAFRELIPPFGAFGNPIDLTGGEPPETYRRALRLALQDDRVDAIALGYWHTILTPPLTFAQLVIDVLEETRGKSRPKPVVASLMGDVEVEDACRLLEQHGVPAFPYAAERPISALAASYYWARHAGKIERSKQSII
ncbi:MAG: CoA-binding protein [Dehalococcoidia bacterium]|nr:CoA-binding protein [Dehalococcoidia bacterium]